MKSRRFLRAACLVLVIIYWAVTVLVMLFVMPGGFFQLLDVERQRPGRPGQEIVRKERRNLLDLLTAPIQVPLVGAYVVYASIDDRTGGYAEQRAFQRTVQHADRVVIRDGGFGCCRDVDTCAAYYVITNQAEIVAFNRMFQFSGKGEGCKCCGDFGIDWWQGTNRIALTAVHHGKTLQWKGFGGKYARLRQASSQEIMAWYNAHCREVEQAVHKDILEGRRPRPSRRK